MPAVVRGGRRQSSKPAPKKPAKAAARKPAARSGAATGKLHAMNGVGLSPRATGVAVLCVLALSAGVILLTGGRAQALGAAFGSALDGRMAAIGFRLEKVHIEGASKDALPAIKESLGLFRGQPLARMNLDELKAKVEAVGWVKQAKVLRLLPDTLVVTVVERERLAVWQHGGQTVVIDADGQAIPEADPSRFSGLPLVVGEGANEAAGALMPLIAQRPRLNDRIEAMVRVDGRRWDLRLKDGSLIQLPAINEDSALIQLDQLDQRAKVLELGFARIDLRDPEMIAVRPRGQAMSPAASAPPVEG